MSHRTPSENPGSHVASGRSSASALSPPVATTNGVRGRRRATTTRTIPFARPPAATVFMMIPHLARCGIMSDEAAPSLATTATALLRPFDPSAELGTGKLRASACACGERRRALWSVARRWQAGHVCRHAICVLRVSAAARTRTSPQRHSTGCHGRADWLGRAQSARDPGLAGHVTKDGKPNGPAIRRDPGAGPRAAHAVSARPASLNSSHSVVRVREGTGGRSGERRD
jgi:hypothetical protein